MASCFSTPNASVGLYADDSCVTVCSIYKQWVGFSEGSAFKSFHLVKIQSSESKYFDLIL